MRQTHRARIAILALTTAAFVGGQAPAAEAAKSKNRQPAAKSQKGAKVRPGTARKPTRKTAARTAVLGKKLRQAESASRSNSPPVFRGTIRVRSRDHGRFDDAAQRLVTAAENPFSPRPIGGGWQYEVRKNGRLVGGHVEVVTEAVLTYGDRYNVVVQTIASDIDGGQWFPRAKTMHYETAEGGSTLRKTLSRPGTPGNFGDLIRLPAPSDMVPGHTWSSSAPTSVKGVDVEARMDGKVVRTVRQRDPKGIMRRGIELEVTQSTILGSTATKQATTTFVLLEGVGIASKRTTYSNGQVEEYVLAQFSSGE